MKIDMKDSHYQILLSILNAQLDSDDTVYAFGSRAKGTAKEYSDLDLAIVTNKNIFELKEELSESDLPYFVDILNYKEIPEHMKEEIDSHKINIKFNNV